MHAWNSLLQVWVHTPLTHESSLLQQSLSNDPVVVQGSPRAAQVWHFVAIVPSDLT